MKRLILATLLLCLGTAATAQSFPKPPDVPNYVPVTPIYKTDGTANTPIDVSVTPPPAYSYELPDIPIPSTTNRIVVGTQPNNVQGFCDVDSFGGTTTHPGITCPQAKFRTHIDFSHMLPDDPIRNYGQPGQSHLHCFFGNGTANAYSTYKSLRKQGLTSTAAGTDANATGYWYPCMVKVNPFGDGSNYAIRADQIVVYYVSDYPNEMPRAAHLIAGLRYVFGYEMDDDYAWLQSIINAANTASGTGRYRLNNTSGRKFPAYYVCIGATATTPFIGGVTSSAQYIVNPDGSDPYNGTCNTGQDFYIDIDGPDCWDGVNLWSPGGYKHVIPMIYDSVAGRGVCPSNYYEIPHLELKIYFTQNGWADRQTWVLSSDLAKRSATGQGASVWPAGSTFHTDWMNGWDQTTLLKWNRNCLGVDNNIPHQCSTSIISKTEYLKGGLVDSEAGAGGRNPQISTSKQAHTNPTDPGFMLIPPAWNGSLTGMKMCHGTGSMNGQSTGPC